MDLTQILNGAFTSPVHFITYCLSLLFVAFITSILWKIYNKLSHIVDTYDDTCKTVNTNTKDIAELRKTVCEYIKTTNAMNSKINSVLNVNDRLTKLEKSVENLSEMIKQFHDYLENNPVETNLIRSKFKKQNKQPR